MHPPHLLDLYVPGRPVPQGSMRPVRTGTGRLAAVHGKRLVDYRAYLTLCLSEHWQQPAHVGPVKVALRIDLARPATHYGTGRNRETVKAQAPAAPTGKGSGDVDKVARCVLDALTLAGVVGDDAQVVRLVIGKGWTSQSGLHVRVAPWVPLDW